MHVVRRTTAVLAATLLGAGLMGAPAAPVAAAVPTVDLEPAELTRGPDVAVPHVEGDDLVVGDRRVDLPAERVRLLGASGDAHVVVLSAENGSRARVVSVGPDDVLTTLVARATPLDVKLSEDGRRVVTLRYGTRRASVVSVRSATTGRLLTRRSFRNYPSVLAAKGAKVLLTTAERGVFWWSVRTDRTTTVTPRGGSRVSITHDLLATYTGDPYQGGCTVLTRLSAPDSQLWKSCTERVDAFSPDGMRMATIGILVDGIGPGEVAQREVDGTLLGTYTSTGWFGTFSWESSTAMLLDTYGKRETAVVRCVLDDCENATDPVETVDYRPAARPGLSLLRRP